jgi:hypothetical protein
VKTLYLDGAWDLALDSAGNIAVATEPYQMAQDAASAIRTFLGEVYYDTARGVPYFQDVLGQRPPLELVRSLLTDAALTAAGVVAAKVFLTTMTPTITGQVQVTDAAGVTSAAGF